MVGIGMDYPTRRTPPAPQHPARLAARPHLRMAVRGGGSMKSKPNTSSMPMACGRGVGWEGDRACVRVYASVV